MFKMLITVKILAD